AQITAGGETVAVVGEAHPDVADRFALTERAFVADVYLDRLYRHAKPLDTVNDLLRTPAVGRDIALVLPDGQPLLPVQQAICRAAGDLLEDVRLFDVYRGAQAGEGKKSAAFAMTFRAPDRTLTEQEITALMDRIVRSVTAQFGAEVRS
ncbi:MAG: phenylalanine--tRNA ligase subunit beta, partial [Clostridiales bacterium]|nr:phenylalanine--tRNA ligase subunit beta [Clostridiales bacterium]